MKYLYYLTLYFGMIYNVVAANDDLTTCYQFVHVQKNHKSAHTNNSCINAATSGNPSAQYSVGIGYLSAGDQDNALKYLKMADNNNAPPASLAIAQIISTKNESEAIYWYKKHIKVTIDSHENGSAGYAALLLAKIYSSAGDHSKGKKWLNVCKQTSVQVECKL